MASRGIFLSAAKTVQLLEKGTNFAKTQIEPVIHPPEIPQDVTDIVEFMKEFTGRALELSGVVGNFKKALFLSNSSTTLHFFY